MKVKLLKTTLPLLIGIFSVGMSLLPASAQSDSVATPAEGSADDLRGLNSRTGVESWGVGGANYPDSGEYAPNQPDNPSLLKPTSEEEQWQQQNRGDVPNQGAKFPVSNF
ncbi:hypothetical protein [Gloeocapsa sp. PCC 73106]|uniref:hypothetical protein n=1 Tax=Gloeocapsa sp. PCC 73106 TaxID=102232 RepID=UPI0002ACBC01|nr:hypothetical protein [Gloeocapsa sp. PCC 73106]ELR99723.1 hypothetical protein GLO73106DRAFT_00035750 [Gloeocapsa sp. PCC 73106]